MKKIGIVDTMFARGDMGSLAEKTVLGYGNNNEIVVSRYTVPGIKDLAVGAKKLLMKEGCEIVIALGMVGDASIDETCAHEANIALMNVEIQEMKHILKVFVHEQEAKGDSVKLASIMKDRTIKHSINAVKMIRDNALLREKAGTGQRQGSGNAATVNLEEVR